MPKYKLPNCSNVTSSWRRNESETNRIENNSDTAAFNEINKQRVLPHALHLLRDEIRKKV
jgi:hypothetical protein